MTSKALEESLGLFGLRLHQLREYGDGVENSFLDSERFKEAVGHLRNARAESEAGNVEASWLQLVCTAEVVGYLNGEIEASARGTPEAGVKELLRKNGRKGGNTRGSNSEQVRSKAAKALIAAAPDGKWPSKAAFDLKYHNIVQKVPGFSDTNYQRLKIMSRADIKATLPRATKRRR